MPGWSLFIQFPNLVPGDCRQRVQLVLLVLNLYPGYYLLGVHSFFTVSKTSTRGLSARGYRLFIRLRIYFHRSKSGVQSVYKVSEPTSRKLCLGRAFVYGFRAYFQGTVSRKCSLNVFVQNIHPGDFCVGCILFYGFQTFFQGSAGWGL